MKQELQRKKQDILNAIQNQVVGVEQMLDELIGMAEKDAEKVRKWDDLGQMIAKCYSSYTDEGKEIPPEKTNADLTDIGEMAALAFGYF